MDFRVIDRQELDLPSWEALVHDRLFYQTVAWADICASGLPHHAHAVFLCGFAQGRLKAGLPAITTSRLGFRSFFSMPDGAYGGAVFAPDINEDSKKQYYAHLSSFLRPGRFAHIAIADYDNSLAGWADCSLARATYATHIIELSEKAAYVPPDKGTVVDIRAGKKRGGEIIPMTSARLEEFFRLYRMTEKRHGRSRTRYAIAFFGAILRHLEGTGQLYWTGLQADGALVASQINFIHGDMLYHWMVVSDYDKRWFKPNHVLLSDAIEYARQRGIRRINLGASPETAAGLRKFKEQWGGQPFTYDVLSYRSRLHRLVRRG